jgi:hypothetical protein
MHNIQQSRWQLLQLHRACPYQHYDKPNMHRQQLHGSVINSTRDTSPIIASLGGTVEQGAATVACLGRCCIIVAICQVTPAGRRTLCSSYMQRFRYNPQATRTIVPGVGSEQQITAHAAANLANLVNCIKLQLPVKHASSPCAPGQRCCRCCPTAL